jgi:hypothetical protein
MPQLPGCDGSFICLNRSPLAGFLPRAQAKKGSGANTRTQLSFKLTSNPPPGRDCRRCVGAYDQPNSEGFDEGVVAECGKPKSRGCIDGGAAIEFLAARSNSSPQSMGGRIRFPSSLGAPELSSTAGEGVAFGRRDRCEACTGFLTRLSGTTIVGAINTSWRFGDEERITGCVVAKSTQTTATWSATTAAKIDDCRAPR